MVNVDTIMAYENGSLSEKDTIKMFQEMIDNGSAWTLQGHYGRTARRLIEDGLCEPEYRGWWEHVCFYCHKGGDQTPKNPSRTDWCVMCGHRAEGIKRRLK